MNKQKKIFTILFITIALVAMIGYAKAAGSPTTTTTVLSASTITFGSSVTDTATVTTGATGLVDFEVSLNGGSTWFQYDVQTLSGSSATSAAYVPLNAGTYYFRAIYIGDALFAGSQSGDTSEPLTVNKAASTTTTVLSASTITFGSSVTDTATVTTGATGVIDFEVSSNGGSTWFQYDVQTLSGSSATSASYTPPNSGTYNFRAIYTGSGQYTSSQSSDTAELLTVNKATSTTTTVLSSTAISLGGSVTDTATVTPGGTGVVDFLVSSNGGSTWFQYNVQTLSAGSATSAAYTPGDHGTYYFMAVYTGDGQYAGSQSADIAEPLVVHTTTVASVTITPAASTINAGSSQTYTATAHDEFADAWNVTSSTTWSTSSGALGSWNSNVYTSANAGTWTITGTYASTPYTTTLTVNPNALSRFVFDTVGLQVAGTPFSVTITALDASGNTLTTYSGTPTLSYSAGSISPSSATGGFSNGVWTGMVTVTVAGSSVTLGVTDDSAHTGTSNTFTVNPSIAVSVTVSPSSATITAGNTETYTATASDTYGNTWDITSATTWTISSGAAGSWSNNVYTSATVGSWTITAAYTGLQGTTQLIVSSTLAAPTVSTSASTVDQGQTSDLTSTSVTNGASPYTYQWFEELPSANFYSAISGATSTSYSFAPTSLNATGVYSFKLQVTDASLAVITSNSVSVTVNIAPTVTVSPTSWTMNVGQSQTFTATPTGGSGTYTSYQWFIGGLAQAGQNASTLSYSPASSGYYSITVTVTDSLGATSIQSNAATVTASVPASTNPTPTPVPTAKPTATPTPTPTPTAKPTATPTLTPTATAAAFVFSTIDWLITIIVIIIVLILILLVWFKRFRKPKTQQTPKK
jgi:hypothetical protein